MALESPWSGETICFLLQDSRTKTCHLPTNHGCIWATLLSTSPSSCLARFSFTLTYTCFILHLPGYKLDFLVLILNTTLYLPKDKNQAPSLFSCKSNMFDFFLSHYDIHIQTRNKTQMYSLVRFTKYTHLQNHHSDCLKIWASFMPCPFIHPQVNHSDFSQNQRFVLSVLYCM